MAPMLQN